MVDGTIKTLRLPGFERGFEDESGVTVISNLVGLSKGSARFDEEFSLSW